MSNFDAKNSLKPLWRSLVFVQYQSQRISSDNNLLGNALGIAKALAIYRIEKPRNPENRRKIGKI